MFRGVGYHLRIVVHRQTAIAPLLAFLGLLAAIYASPAGPPLSAGAVPAMTLFPLAAWLTRAVATAESEPFAEITLVALGGPLARRRAQVLAVLAAVSALTVVAVGWAVLANHPAQYSVPAVAAVVGMCLAESVAGIGLGLLAGPPLRPGAAVLAVTAAVVLSLAVPGCPPLNPLLHVAERVPSASSLALASAAVQAAAFGVVAALARGLLDRRPVRRSPRPRAAA